MAGCKKPSPPLGPPALPPAAATNASPTTIASLVPAATDLIIGMGAMNQLVAVSTYDRQRPDVGQLPKVGDYQSVDWEALQACHPNAMVIQIRKDRLPPGFAERAAAMKVSLVDVGIDRLEDVFTALDTLGTALGRVDLAAAARHQMQDRFDAVEQRVAGLTKVSALIVLSDSGASVAGPDTYLDALLGLAGGSNAAAGLGKRYPQIDREVLLSLKPDVIIQLLPDASPQVKERAAAVWAQMPQIPAVASGRVYTIDNWYALLPGWHVTDLAEKFAQCLHPLNPSSPPTTAR